MAIPETLVEIQAKLLELEAKIDADRVIYYTCASCNGNGQIGGNPSNCVDCDGTGFRVHGKITKIKE